MKISGNRVTLLYCKHITMKLLKGAVLLLLAVVFAKLGISFLKAVSSTLGLGLFAQLFLSSWIVVSVLTYGFTSMNRVIVKINRKKFTKFIMAAWFLALSFSINGFVRVVLKMLRSTF